MDRMNSRVLIVEDNRVFANVLRFNLERAGFMVTVAYDGTQAIATLQHGHFDLLITDFQMPDINGDQLCRVVRGQLRLEHLPIVICSAKGCEISAAQLQADYRVRHVIFKPFSMRDIISIVQTITAAPAVDPDVQRQLC